MALSEVHNDVYEMATSRWIHHDHRRCRPVRELSSLSHDRSWFIFLLTINHLPRTHLNLSSSVDRAPGKFFLEMSTSGSVAHAHATRTSAHWNSEEGNGLPGKGTVWERAVLGYTQRTACRRTRCCHLRTDEANNVVYRLFWEGGAALECSDGFEFDYLPENRQGVT